VKNGSGHESKGGKCTGRREKCNGCENDHTTRVKGDVQGSNEAGESEMLEDTLEDESRRVWCGTGSSSDMTTSRSGS
jgi:hypothetical protein